MAGKNSASGKKSGFDYLAGQESRRITTVEVGDDHTLIEWEEASGREGESKQAIEGKTKSPEPSHPDFSEAFQSLGEWVRKWMIPNSGDRCQKAWAEAIHIKSVSFAHNEKSGITAKIAFDKTEPINGGKRQVSTQIKTPALPLYDKQIEGHANNMVTTYPEEVTKILTTIMQEAKMFLGGKRGRDKGDGGMFESVTPVEEPAAASK